VPFADDGLGALLTTRIEHVDLGQVGTRALRARVQRRQLRLAAGRRRGLRIAIGRLRPVAVEITEPGRTYEVAIPRVTDPRLIAARGIAVLMAASLAIRWWARHRRRRAADARLS